MLTEIKNLHRQINHNQMVRVIMLRNDFETRIGKTDILKVTKSGMLRIVRADGKITSINPEFIVMVCIIRKDMII